LSSANTATASASARVDHFSTAMPRATLSRSPANSSSASAPSTAASGATTLSTASPPPCPDRLASAASFTASVPISAIASR
jgi:hypothetical protein